MLIGEGLAIVGDGHEGLGISDHYDCHVYYVDCGDSAVLIDSGSGLNPGMILDNITNDNLDPQRISQILLTHGHGDHAGGAAALSHELGARVLIGQPEHEWLRAGNQESLGATLGRRKGFYPADYVIPAVPEAVAVSDGDICVEGSLRRIEAVATPGHTKGSMSYLMVEEGRRTLFSGDFLFAGGAPGIINVDGCDLADYRRSIKKVESLAPIDSLLPGHYMFVLHGAYQSHIAPAVHAFGEVMLPRNAW